MRKVAFAAVLLIFAVFGLTNMRPELDSPAVLDTTAAAKQLPKKLIVLTFDDGPRPKVLFGESGLVPLLQANNLPAHFFMVGKLVELNRDRVKFLHEKGFLIENHSYGHENLLEVARFGGEKSCLENIRKTNNIIYEATGRKPQYFRPPYLATNSLIKNVAEREGLIAISPHKAEIDTRDYVFNSKKRVSDELVAYVKKEIALQEQAGFTKHILLFHELPITTEALESLIPWLLSQDYQFLTLDDFLK